MPAKAIVADDHPLFRSAMRQAVEGILGNHILESSTLDESIDFLQKNDDVELVFLDLKMPGNQGLLGLTRIRNAFPDVLVVIVSAEENPALIRKSIALGSSGYIPKSTPLPMIASAVAQILEGEIWLPAELAEQVEQSADSTEQQFARKLELLLADGLLNKQIAYELKVSESTIKQHVSAVLHKLGFNNRTQAGVLFKQVMAAEEQT